jgi:zinc D-Ala-D-Ala carboxypeptidase
VITIEDRPLSEHFSLAELTASRDHPAIDNTPSEIIIANLVQLAQALENVRTLLGQPIHINSGYRCDLLNAAVGGSRKSRHMHGLAADFICPAFGTPVAIAHMLVANLDGFDQLIYEHSWVHLGLAIPGEDARGQVLTLMSGGGYEEGIIGQV